MDTSIVLFFLIGILVTIVMVMSMLGNKAWSGSYQHHYSPYARRRPGSGLLLVAVLLVLAILGMGLLERNEEIKAKEVTADQRWHQPPEPERPVRPSETPFSADEQEGLLATADPEPPAANQAAVVGVPMGELERGLQARLSQPVPSEPKLRYRLQLLAGSNEYDALEAAGEIHQKLRVSVFVMRDLEAATMRYKIMIGDFPGRKAAVQYAKQYMPTLEYLLREMKEGKYELIHAIH